MADYRLFIRSRWLGNEPLLFGLNLKQLCVHFIGIPIFLGFAAGWPQAGRTVAWPKEHAVFFWIGLSTCGWWANDLITRALAKPLRQLGVSLPGTLMIGVVVASLPSDGALKLWVHAYLAMFPDLPMTRPLPQIHLDPIIFLKTHIYGYIEWPLINLVLFHLWKMPCFGYLFQTDTYQSPTITEPVLPFMSKIPVPLQGEVIALAAEQHYLRVYTSLGEALILYRLSDAIRDLGARGMQVHRSYWVSSGAVIKVLRTRTSQSLLLHNGLEVPVSRSFRQTVQQASYLQLAPA
ncbi:LytTR family DNA-binding domain-containing protein [Novosphingobium sp. P6W]|uniref:LytTR family DNA-binding domain-containing protein n=1 Tax=Novosphingobium sp. P6W TaxID=1609758 RepID=UPI000698F2D0|nr:LytTR family DNA-binding domain-containing protein [Novosphingobium sp. P6W]AXB79002.1 LytTR family transcriptional regulator [Novosphingobium sp. P6W]